MGTAGRGLCGGMVLAAADYWVAGRRPPALTLLPSTENPLWRYLVRRQVDSFGLPLAVLRYWVWMLPVVPARWRARWLRRRVVPAVCAVLDAGWPCPLGVVMVRSLAPWRMVYNHQVLAWGYERPGAGCRPERPGAGCRPERPGAGCQSEGIRLRVYDPNRPGADDVTVDIDGAGRQVSLGDGGREAVVTVFVTGWTPRDPPA